MEGKCEFVKNGLVKLELLEGVIARIPTLKRSESLMQEFLPA